ncbi:hypothetical protein ACHAXA_004368 [Cyclostephanos tholiformis]|uniref:Crossover junction endonuclease MUS81 n=1 Tax=Cyclostephanos tholiformis TaxID=382380 RepID=A0ABD3R8P1_9STRA
MRRLSVPIRGIGEIQRVDGGNGGGGGNDDGTTSTNGGERRRGGAFKQQSHIFKPMKKDGNPTTDWILFEEKLRIQSNVRREFSSSGLTGHFFTPRYDSPQIDWLEEFVRRDHARHCTTGRRDSSVGCDDYAAADTRNIAYLANIPPRRQRSPSRSNGSGSNNDRELSEVGAASSPARAASYILQYDSGPFVVLATLHLARHSRHRHSNGRRLLTLTKDQLKRMAQIMCRSNLYDKVRICGRNAFACMDGLMEKQFVRKEIVRNAGDDVEKWGPLRGAEALAEKCADFDNAVNCVIPLRNIIETHIKSNANLSLCLNAREDVHLIERMKMRCEDEKVPFVVRELPADDCLFIDQSGPQEYVLLLVIERKSWSDLADSCLGKGRALNRLD